jgi:hypothetical protein
VKVLSGAGGEAAADAETGSAALPARRAAMTDTVSSLRMILLMSSLS